MNSINEADKPKVTKLVVVYSGRFQPFHKGHYATYSKLVSKFGANNVYIGTSNDTSSDKSPFNFNEKKKIATTMFGIPSSKFIRVGNPYAPKEVLSKFDGKTTQYIAAVGEKDANRLHGKYFKPYNNKMGYGYDEIGYVYPVPAEQNPISGTDVRNGLGSNDAEKSKKFFLKAYPKFDKDIYKMITGKLNESVNTEPPSELRPEPHPTRHDIEHPEDEKKAFDGNKAPYDPISELLGRVAAEEMFKDFVNEYFNEAENKALDVDISYTNSKGEPKKIKARDALRLPKDHPAHIQASKIAGPEDAPANEPKKKEEPGKAAAQSAKPAQPGQPVKKDQTSQGKADKAKGGEAPTAEAPPPNKLSGAELKSSAEKPPVDPKEEKIKQHLDKEIANLSKDDHKSIDVVNNPQSQERKGAINTLKKAASYVGHGITHMLEHNKEMMVGTGRAIKSLATTGRFGAVKDKNGKNVHWDDFTEPGEKNLLGKVQPKMQDVPVYKKDSHGHSIKDKDGNKIQDKTFLGKPKTKKEPVYREGLSSEEKELAEKSWKESQRQKTGVKNLAKTTALIMGSIAVTGGLIGGVKAASHGAGIGGILKGAASKAAYKFGGGHLGSYVMKDIIKHSAAEALGANAMQASGIGIALGAAGIFENKDGEEGFDTKKFVPNFMEKTLEIMQNYKLSDEQLIETLNQYKKEGTENQSMANASDLMKENISETKQKSIQHFVEWATGRLKLKEQPKVNLIGGGEFAETKSSLGGYNPQTKEIYVAIEGRLGADILRTIAHEMVHRKQDEMGLVRNESDGNDGSPIENNAHAVAGILMREYGRINKQIYTEDINIDVDKGDTVLMGKFKNKKVVVKDFGKDDHGMPTINGKKATTFRLGDKGQNVFKATDEVGTSDWHFKAIMKLWDKAGSFGRKKIGVAVCANPRATRNDVARELRYSGYKDITNYTDKLGLSEFVEKKTLNELTQGLYAGKIKINGHPVEIEVELLGADNKTKEFLTKVIHIDKKYQSKLPIGSTFKIPSRIFRMPGGGWYKIKSSAFKESLNEGGAYGHMSHPFDDMDLTFGDLKNIISKALNGDLGVVREKTDGQALAISWKNGRLIAARNKSHLANAGAGAMGIADVASKFGGRGALTDAYNFAMRDLTAAISSLSEAQRKKIFNDGKCFMNLEVIWPTSVNVIPYGQAILVFHNTTCYDEKGSAIGANQGAASQLAGMIKQVNADVQSKYTIQGPPVTSIPKNENLSGKQGKYLGKLSKLQSQFGLSDSDNVANYHQAWWENFINTKSPEKVDKLTRDALVRRWAFGEKAFRLDKNNITNEKILAWAINNDKVNVAKQQKDNIRPFEEIFLGVGADILDFVSSVLTVHPDKAIRAMKDKFKSVASQVRTAGNPAQIAKLKAELGRLNKLGGIDRIVASEGLVFFYGGKTYKLTGTFAPLNQILGIFYA